MVFTKVRSFILLSLLIVVSYHCAPSIPPLTAEQLRIEIVNGTQAKTLALSKTHTPVGSAVVSSQYDARIHAVKVSADVAQLIYSDESRNEYTYRFWKKK